MRQDSGADDAGIESCIPTRLSKREIAAGSAENPPVGGYLTTQSLPPLSGFWPHATKTQSAVATTQLRQVKVRPDKHLTAKTAPSVFAILHDTLVIVVLYDACNHHWSGASQKPPLRRPSLRCGQTSSEWIAPMTFHAACPRCSSSRQPDRNR